MKITYEKNYNQSLFIQYKSLNLNILKDRNDNIFTTKKRTVYYNDKLFCLLNITKSNKIYIFKTNNWVLCEFWFNENINDINEVITKIINDNIKNYKNLEYIIININVNSKQKDLLQKFINKNKFKLIKDVESNIIYKLLNIKNDNELYYTKLKNNTLLKESFKLYHLSEVYCNKENEFKIIQKIKDNKSYLLELKEKIFILPYYKNKNKIKIIAKKTNNIFNNDIIIPIQYKCKRKELKNTDKKILLKEILQNNNIKIKENSDLNFEFIGEYFQNDNLDIKPCLYYTVDLSNKIDELNKDAHNITHLTIQKTLKLTKSLSLINMINSIINKFIKNRYTDKKINNILNNETKEIDENFSVSLPSYENLDKNNNVIKTEYPDNIIDKSLKIIRTNKKYRK